MEDRGDVISIKFSYDMKILAIQRSHKSVVSDVLSRCGWFLLQAFLASLSLRTFLIQEFVNFSEGLDVLEYSQSCKVSRKTTTKCLIVCVSFGLRRESGADMLGCSVCACVRACVCSDCFFMWVHWRCPLLWTVLVAQALLVGP